MSTATTRRATWIVLLASGIGLGGFFYPFLLPALEQVTGDRDAHASDAPLLFAVVTMLCAVAILVELGDVGSGSGAMSKRVALLGALVAIDATLRLAPTFLGASPIFPLIVLVGAVFGPAFGFQMGALTLLVSGFLTGGVGPYLPYEMLGAGWVGLTAGWLPRPARFSWWIALLAVFAAGWGFLYGALLNLWFWPFAAPGVETDAGLYWIPGMSAGETFRHYAKFYLVTSLGYDLFRAIANAVLVLALGGPLLRVLERFRRRFGWEPWTAFEAPAAGT